MSMADKDEEWRERLSPLAYNVTRLGGTERPYSGEHYLEERDGSTTVSAVATSYSHQR